jgi:hypothetical protein
MKPGIFVRNAKLQASLPRHGSGRHASVDNFVAISSGGQM